MYRVFLVVGYICYIVWRLYRVLFCSFFFMNKDGRKNYSRMRKGDAEQIQFRVQSGIR